MDFTQFVEVFGIFLALAGIALAAMTYFDSIIGEVAGQAAAAVLIFDVYAYVIGWPSDRPTGPLWLVGALWFYAVIVFVLHTRVFEPARRRLRPEFKIELIGAPYIFQSRRPTQRNLWLPIRITNSGAPSSIKDRRINIVFSPNAGFTLPNGTRLPSFFFGEIGALGPDGKRSAWWDTQVIVTNGQLVGWIGIGVLHAPTIDEGLQCDGCQFAGISELTLSCSDQKNNWVELRISRETVGATENNCLIEEVFRAAGES